MIRLLHISDIHFKSPQCIDPDTDPDVSIRDLLSEDIQSFATKSDKNVDAILITGDIAFAGKVTEYSAASIWLDELCKVTGCQPQDVYVVPGNHDIDRIKADSPILAAFREQVLSKQSKLERDDKMNSFLLDPLSRQTIFSTMQAYNDFASRYGCEINLSTCWRDSIAVSENVDLNLIGMTSTLLSSAQDDLHRLVVDCSQTVFRKQPGKLYLTMMHHPCDWIIDGNVVQDNLDNHIHIQLFGHTHRSRWNETDNTIRISAISLHPERHDLEYEPGYNIIDISNMDSTTGVSNIEVKVFVRVLQQHPLRFIAKEFKEGKNYFSRIFAIRNKVFTTDENIAGCAPSSNEFFFNDLAVAPEERFHSIDAMLNTKSVRELVYDFWGLTGSQKRKILEELRLLTDDDWNLPDVERQKIAFKNAEDRGQLKELEQVIILRMQENVR
ncbi:metallophosphoesterase [Shewanella baltica]|uniref:metallophosphoesterase n=1 Tax=Shewanella baltica TaxID=62322 RepID=UPI003D78CC93